MTMTIADLVALLPMIVLSGGTVVLMAGIAFRRSNGLAAWLTGLCLLVSLACLWPASGSLPVRVPPLFLIDGYFTFATALVLLSSLAVLLLSHGYVGALRSSPADEYYLLLLIATLGAVVMLGSDHFATFFLGLETLSVALLGLIAYPRHRPDATEAGMKYLVLAGTSSAFLLFGIALIYAAQGTLSFSAAGSGAGHTVGVYRLVASALILTGIGYKLSIVPFHMWAPDVYEGAPAPVGGFIAVISKLSVFTVLMRYFVAGPGRMDHAAMSAIAVFAILSMVAGNLLALGQDNLKRILAYSSIAHLGYLLVAFLSPETFGIAASSYYLAAYAVTTLGAFGVIGILSDPAAPHDVAEIDAYRGLFWRRPWLAGILTLMLISLAGIPPTMGFIAKAYVMTAGVGSHLTLPLIALILGSIIGLYYYLRIVVVMAMPVSDRLGDRTVFPTRFSGVATLGVLAVLVVVLGLVPSMLIAPIQHADPRMNSEFVHAATASSLLSDRKLGSHSE
ncbi:NADH-quinone oxidoreductase subunit N [Lichenicola cladoniae]|uniref:NADH-quinone oxidoreductase subunit N n=1 Tax=Lichenicola cladoniae TaxID=1484109 RepID=A0A6M8HPY6_9PROT|nr:NADH-quinone oxidoreductase subunit N [Lichenicola cladoniae]NPD69696.1 NADH-quinone oxidoreductase subunit N [Acetobacteraceae bacterium]QKE90398.1 NADH-quinone oxidoreductase subunit N [Lichenicola cladoniae]